MLQGTMHAVPGGVAKRADLVAVVIGGQNPDAMPGRISDQVTRSSDVVTGSGENSHALRLTGSAQWKMAATAARHSPAPTSAPHRDAGGTHSATMAATRNSSAAM